MSLLATKDTLINYQIGIGGDIYFLGFPSSFYDKRNFSPILRFGVIATDPTSDYFYNDNLIVGTKKRFGYLLPDKLTGFLIDASAFGGSSGSLVVIKPRPIPLMQGGKPIPTIGYPLILGILTESHYDIGSEKEVAVRLNLGSVISAEIIKQTIEDFPMEILNRP